jgi:hypothetical protein
MGSRPVREFQIDSAGSLHAKAWVRGKLTIFRELDDVYGYYAAGGVRDPVDIVKTDTSALLPDNSPQITPIHFQSRTSVTAVWGRTGAWERTVVEFPDGGRAVQTGEWEYTAPSGKRGWRTGGGRFAEWGFPRGEQRAPLPLPLAAAPRPPPPQDVGDRDFAAVLHKYTASPA